tara:strand:+ start:794 stop:1210 length:417 start_codon:yes stop_codon:yes gene_type:complete
LIGLIIITHGNLALELKSSLEHIIGPQQNIETICIGYDDDIEKRKDEIKELINEVNQDNGVILLTDMFGNTPSNLLISLIKKDKIEMVGGVNLPLLVKLGSIREEMDLKSAIEEAVKAGHKYIGIASEILSNDEDQNI